MKRAELNKKIKAIVEAVANTGVKVSSVNIDTDAISVNKMGEIIPEILDLELIVKIGLRLVEDD